jgi:hypothetical protein
MDSDSDGDCAETQDEKSEWLSKLKRTYAGAAVKRDMFGRRPASPHEVEMALAARRSKTAVSSED